MNIINCTNGLSRRKYCFGVIAPVCAVCLFLSGCGSEAAAEPAEYVSKVVINDANPEEDASNKKADDDLVNPDSVDDNDNRDDDIDNVDNNNSTNNEHDLNNNKENNNDMNNDAEIIYTDEFDITVEAGQSDNARAGRVSQSNLARDQFLALTDSEEEAKAIAEDYGITLVSYSYGVATYHTDEEDLSAVRARGSGKYKLEYNYVRTIQNKAF